MVAIQSLIMGLLFSCLTQGRAIPAPSAIEALNIKTTLLSKRAPDAVRETSYPLLLLQLTLPAAF
jgi:hypothetical protein